MFRFGLRRPATVGASFTAIRYQSGFTQTSSGVKEGDPAMDIYDLKDEVADGKHIRITYRPGLRSVSITNYPQAGPRKIDPNDPTPQFDYDRRTSAKLRPYELASMLAVMESKQKEASLTTRGWDLKFAAAPSGTTGFNLSGSIARAGGDDRDEWKLNFSGVYTTQLYRFLDRSLTETFQFPRKKEYVYSRGGNSGGDRPMNLGNAGTGANRGGFQRRDNRDGGNFQRRDNRSDNRSDNRDRRNYGEDRRDRD